MNCGSVSACHSLAGAGRRKGRKTKWLRWGVFMFFSVWVRGSVVAVVFQTAFQIAQGLEARPLELANPAVVDFLQRHWVQEMQLLPAAPLHGDQVCRFEHGKVLCDSLPRHVQVLTELAQCLTIV